MLQSWERWTGSYFWLYWVANLPKITKQGHKFESLELQFTVFMFWCLYENQNFGRYPGSYQCYSWSWERRGSPGFFLWSFWHPCCHITEHILEQQNNMFKEQTASLGFFQSTTVWGLQKPPHTSIFHKSFYETSYEAIKMIHGPFLILVYWTLPSRIWRWNIFQNWHNTGARIHIASSPHWK